MGGDTDQDASEPRVVTLRAGNARLRIYNSAKLRKTRGTICATNCARAQMYKRARGHSVRVAHLSPFTCIGLRETLSRTKAPRRLSPFSGETLRHMEYL